VKTLLPTIDMHAHLTPQRYKDAIRTNGQWHGLFSDAGELHYPGFRLSVEERLAEMNALGVDMQMLSPTVGFYQYDKDPEITKAIARECNDEIAALTAEHPDRFVGMATLPMQDLTAAVAEMDRTIVDLGFKGVIIGDHVNGHTYDEPEFQPFWKEAESLRALVFFHQGETTIVNERIARYHLDNSVGNLTERALTFGALVFGGVLDKFPDLKPYLAHGGGYAAYGAARMDKTAGALEADASSGFSGYKPPLDSELQKTWSPLLSAPSDYLSRFYYDCCTFSGPTLRFLIDAVGIDRVVLGTDYPAPMVLLDAVNWINGLDCLTAAEKAAILAANPSNLVLSAAQVRSRQTSIENRKV
jgi:aminocarboxymuconate-semialdehyde decarboxylase